MCHQRNGSVHVPAGWTRRPSADAIQQCCRIFLQVRYEEVCWSQSLMQISSRSSIQVNSRLPITGQKSRRPYLRIRLWYTLYDCYIPHTSVSWDQRDDDMTWRWHDLVNRLLQTVHSNVFSLEWIRMCNVSALLLSEHLPHSVLTLTCTNIHVSVKAAVKLKMLPHSLLEYNCYLLCLSMICANLCGDGWNEHSDLSQHYA